MYTDPDLPGILIQEKQDGLISRCTSFTIDHSTASKFAIGCILVKKDTGIVYVNKGTVAVPSWVSVNDNPLVETNSEIKETFIQYAEVAISAADIVATGAGKLGHANGVPLVAAPGTGKALELISAVAIYDYDTAAYGGGGNVTVNWAGGAAITGLVSAANSFGASADKIVQFLPLATAGNAVSLNTAINLVAASAFTQPGTAAGVIRIKIAYRVHTTELA